MLADPNNDAGWFGRFTHYDFLILAGGEAGFVVTRALDLMWRPSPLSDVLAVISLVAIILGARAQFRHTRRPCEKCIADMPLDAEAQADKKRLSLRLSHRMESQAWLITLAVLFTMAWWGPPWLGSVAMTVIAIATAAGFFASWQHRPLQLVCPWCRRKRGWDDGSEPERTPTPDPAGAKSA